MKVLKQNKDEKVAQKLKLTLDNCEKEREDRQRLKKNDKNREMQGFIKISNTSHSK